MVTGIDIVTRLKKNSFKPFRVVARDGTRYDVLAWFHALPMQDEVLLPAELEAGLVKEISYRKYEELDHVEDLQAGANAKS